MHIIILRVSGHMPCGLQFEEGHVTQYGCLPIIEQRPYPTQVIRAALDTYIKCLANASGQPWVLAQERPCQCPGCRPTPSKSELLTKIKPADSQPTQPPRRTFGTTSLPPATREPPPPPPPRSPSPEPEVLPIECLPPAFRANAMMEAHVRRKEEKERKRKTRPPQPRH
jgi:hypothetical protein